MNNIKNLSIIILSIIILLLVTSCCISEKALIKKITTNPQRELVIRMDTMFLTKDSVDTLYYPLKSETIIIHDSVVRYIDTGFVMKKGRVVLSVKKQSGNGLKITANCKSDTITYPVEVIKLVDSTKERVYVWYEYTILAFAIIGLVALFYSIRLLFK